MKNLFFSHLVISNPLLPHGMQHARPPCPSLSPRACSNSCQLGHHPTNLILCYPLLILYLTFPSIRVFSRESVLCISWPKYWSFSFSISPSNIYSGLISFRIDCFALIAVQGTSYSKFALRSSYLVWLGYFQRYQDYDSLENECPMTMTVIGKDPDAGNDWKLEEKGMTENEMVGWHYQVSSVQFRSLVMSDSAMPWTAGCRLPCPPTPSTYSTSCPWSRWCHLAPSLHGK